MLGLRSRARRSSTATCCTTSHHSEDEFVEAPGHRGQVMLVFTLPSYPVRLQGDQGPLRAGQGHRPRERSWSKFQMVKRASTASGGMADTLEFIDLALPRERFAPALLEQLARAGADSIEPDGETARDPPLLRRAAHGAAQHLPRPRRAPTSSSGGARVRQRDHASSRSRTSSRATCSGGTSASPATAGSSSTTTTRSNT